MPYKDRAKQLEYLRKYNKTYQSNRYEAAKMEYIKYLGGKCVKCGSESNLEFDHIDPSTKDFSIMRLWHCKNVYAELDKCQLLCNKCHKEKHRR